MLRDVDEIIECLKEQILGVEIEQLRVTYPADDDGLWFITVPGREGRVQMESSKGVCPFVVESDRTVERFVGRSVEEVVAIVRRLCA
jgi:hypothetical protein